MDWNICGPKRQLDYLEKMIQQDKLAHGLLLAGPSGVGKRAVARALAQKLGAQFPDYIEIAGGGGIKIEQIRELIYKLSLKPYSSKYKVAVIDEAEELTLEAANALLKALEEPKSYTVIILITANPEKLPQTILSRVQKINFGLVPWAQYEHLLPADQKQTIERLAPGRPGLSLAIAADSALAESMAETGEAYQIFVQGSDPAARLMLAADLAQKDTPDLRAILLSWLERLVFELRLSPSERLAARINQVNLSLKYLEQNANSKLLLTNLILNT